MAEKQMVALISLSGALDHQSRDHLIDQLSYYQAMSDSELDQELKSRKSLYDGAKHKTFLARLAEYTGWEGHALVPKLVATYEQVSQLLPARRNALLSVWQDELFFKQEWERLLDETPPALIEALKDQQTRPAHERSPPSAEQRGLSKAEIDALVDETISQHRGVYERLAKR